MTECSQMFVPVKVNYAQWRTPSQIVGRLINCETLPFPRNKRATLTNARSHTRTKHSLECPGEEII